MRAWASRGRGEGGFTLMELLISAAILGLLMAGLLGLLTASRNAYSRGSGTIEAQQNARLALDRMGKEIREAGYHPWPPDTLPLTCPPGAFPVGGLYPVTGGVCLVNCVGHQPSNPCWRFYPVVAPPPATSMPTATALTLQNDWDGDGGVDIGVKVNDPVNCPAGTPVCRGEQVTYCLGVLLPLPACSPSGTALMRQELGVDPIPQAVATGISALAFTYLRDDNSTATLREEIRSVQIVIQVTTDTVTPKTTISMTDQIRLRTR